MLMTRTVCLVLSLVYLLCQTCSGAVVIFLDTNYDDPAVRHDLLDRPEMAARGQLIRRLERKIIDRLMTRGRLESRFSRAQLPDYAELVRPVGADDVMTAEGARASDVPGLTERAAFFEMKNGLGGIYVLFRADGKPFPQCAIFWKPDEDFTELKSLDDCQARLQWEQSRLEALMKLMGVTEEQLSFAPEEFLWIPDK